MHRFDNSTPVLILGGQENSLAIVRSLGRLGIHVAVSGPSFCWALYSRYCQQRLTVPKQIDPIDYWTALLLGDGCERFRGYVLFAGNDDAIEFFAANERSLREHYLMEEFDAELHQALLNKQTTVELAESIGVPAPKQYRVTSLDDVDRLKGSIALPALIKALNTHEFNQVIGSKVLVADESFEQLQAHAKRAFDEDLEIMVVEMIAGGDDQLCSYFTYITDDGQRLYDFTKSVVRRYPVGYGSGACHVTTWQPDVAKMGRRFFEGVGFRGIGNIEFKRDGDDIKIIEVNARFVASHELIVRSGAPLDTIVYCHLTKQPTPRFENYDEALYLWAPIADVLSMLSLRKRGKITARAWAIDLISHEICFPIFQMTDPRPSIHHGASLVAKLAAVCGGYIQRIGRQLIPRRASRHAERVRAPSASRIN